MNSSMTFFVFTMVIGEVFTIGPSSEVWCCRKKDPGMSVMVPVLIFQPITAKSIALTWVSRRARSPPAGYPTSFQRVDDDTA
jgi:hypothetical protein